MPESSEKDLREESLKFFGAIAASATHELNNVFAIIEQTSGLMEDLCTGGEREILVKCEKILSVTDRIARQLQRGTELTRHLNKFAHSVDEPVGLVELNGMLENIVALTQRHASMKRLRLEVKPTEPGITLDTHPFILEQAISSGLHQAISRCRPQGVIAVHPEATEAQTHIIMAYEPATTVPVMTEPPLQFKSLCDLLGGTLSLYRKDQQEFIALTISPNSGDI